MGFYKILVVGSVEKDLRRLPKKYLKRIWDEIKSLAETPFPAGAIKLTGTENTYRIRVGDYRIVYEVWRDEITIKYVRHRKDVYKRMK